MVRERLLRFAIFPKQRINEVTLAGDLGISRTPLREALNRLAAEGLLVDRGRGFAVPELDPELVRQQFEARQEVEAALVRRVCERAADADLAALAAFCADSAAESPDASVDRLVELDIGFHDTLAALSGNAVLRGMLANLNDRIHLVRWIAMEGRRDRTQAEHRAIVEHLQRRDADGAALLMRQHILHRNDDILAAIKAAYGHIHTQSAAPLG
jgi:DNA-binding GntR family transcriptional regulator